MMPVPPAPEGESKFFCPECNRLLRVPAALAGQAFECPRCKNLVPVPYSDAIEPARGPAAPRGDDLYGLPPYQEVDYQRLRQEPPPQEGGMSPAAAGWLIFFLIFVVGNVILYATTGIFLIPIPRR
jgi:hypothetical protein